MPPCGTGSPVPLAPGFQARKSPHLSMFLVEWEICPGISLKVLPSHTAAHTSHLCQDLARG